MLKGKFASRSGLSRKWALFLGFLALAVLITIVLPGSKLGGRGGRGKPEPTTLVIYNFGYWDPEHLNNFNFFIKHGIRGNDGARYVIILDHQIATELMELPAFPSNVQIVKAVGPCNEFGLAGWLFKRFPSLRDHDYFVFVDSSARGPFLPLYARHQPWHRALTSLITRTTKLVGSTISCAPFKYHPNDGGYIIHPYVSAYALATDRIGLHTLNATDPPVFHCYHNPLDIQRYGVVALSEAMLRDNYNLGSLMLKYHGVDFRDASKWGCNGRIDAHWEGHYDGISLDPLEVMFVRLDHVDVVTGLSYVAQALKYDEWMEVNKTEGSEGIGSNDWKQRALRDLRKVQSRGRMCFNAEFYIDTSPFEFRGWTGDQAWEHFIAYGFKEGRPYQFTC